jgi:putative membrane protein
VRYPLASSTQPNTRLGFRLLRGGKGDGMARLFRFVLYLIVAMLALVFALLNAQTIPFNYYFGQVQLPLSLMLAIAIVLGAVLGITVSLGMVLKSKRQASLQRKNADIAGRELAKLRALPLKDNQ